MGQFTVDEIEKIYWLIQGVYSGCLVVLLDTYDQHVAYGMEASQYPKVDS